MAGATGHAVGVDQGGVDRGGVDEGAPGWAATRVEVTGPAELVKHRPWSTVWRLPTAAGPVWLKACPPRTAHEVRLLAALGGWDVPHVLVPLAVDVEAGRVLLPDGGPTLRDTGTAAARWPAALATYARVQRATVPHADDLVALGVPDLRPPALPAVAADLLGRWAPELRGLLPQLTDECAELAALGPPAALQHDDLHDGNVFARGVRPFDWGDACVAHPWTSLLVALDVEDPGPARAAYLAEWAVPADAAARERAAALGVRLGRLTRAHSWERALAGRPVPPPQHRDAPARWLRTLADGSAG